jgi:intracellular septation protein A
MRVWTYLRPFEYRGLDCVVEVTLTLKETISRLFVDNELVDEQSLAYSAGAITFVHPLPSVSSQTARVKAGYYNWWNIGIAVIEEGGIVYESHPGRDVHYGEALAKKMLGLDAESGDSAAAKMRSMAEINQNKWQRNKYSVYADLALGALFFIVGKVTGDLALAAIVGAGGGLALVVAQRFVKVDLLGGFAVFGTIMLLISAAFSLALQDDYWVQMKSTILGLFTASIFMADGLLRRGSYFGARIERYMPLPLHHDRIAVGMSLTGIIMAGANYLVAENFSEDFWLTWTTFLDLPVGMALFYSVVYWARKKPTDGAA